MPARYLVAVAVSLLALAGCGDADGPIESMTLYSLDGDESMPPPPAKPRNGEKFHGFGVLAKTEVSSPADRLAILAAVKKGIAQSDGAEAKCFWPHHGFSMVQNGKNVDYVICFHCLQLQRFIDGAGKTIPTTTAPEADLDAQLVRAGITPFKEKSSAE
jgi:hypothetical protein